METEQIVNLLKNGKIGVMPTDTIYGIVGSALNPKTVEQIYTLRKRSTEKPMIILISSLDDLNKFNIKLTKFQKEFLEKNWPNPVSIVLPSPGEKFAYLHREKNTLAFRMPNNKKLLEILREAGPLVAPSANFEGEKSAESIEDAKKYFFDKVDFYWDEGIISSNPSTLIELKKDSINILRQGTFQIY